MHVLLLILFVNLIGVGVVMPVLPFFALHLGATPMGVTTLFSVHAAVSFFALPIAGRLSDRYGRRPIFLTTLWAGMAGYILFAFSHSFSMLLFSRALGGISSGGISIALAMMADVTPPRERAKGMGQIGAAIGLGIALGPILGGILVGEDPLNPNYQLPALIAAAFVTASALIAGKFLKETFDVPSAEVRAQNKKQSTREVLAILRARRTSLLILQSLIMVFVFASLFAIFPLWAEALHGWREKEVSYAQTVMGLIMFSLQGLFMGPVTRWIGEYKVLLVGATCTALGYMLMAGSTALPVSLVALVILTSGSTICNPTIGSLLSRQSPAQHQGSVLSAASATANLGRIFGPLFGGYIFEKLGPNWPFWFSSLMVGVVAIYALRKVIANEPIYDFEIDEILTPAPVGEDSRSS